jgi:hypothetical protein
MKMRIILLALLLPFYSYSNELEEKIIRAINNAANYSAYVLLDEEGKSRCDYHVTEGVWYPYEEAWHTGQVIYGLLEAYRITGNEEYLNAAKRAGDWWVSLEITDHPKLNGMLMALHGDHAGDVIVFATVSDGTAGLYRLYNATGDEKYARVPTNAGVWMLENMCLLEQGMCYDSVDPLTGEVLTENSPFWPNQEEVTLYNVARPNTEGSLFLDMYRYTGEQKYKEAFLILCESLLEKQGPEGLWMDFTPNNKAQGSFHPRFNLWYAESLIDAYEITGDSRFLDAAKKTAQMYAKVQNSLGTIFYQNFLDGKRNENSITGSAVAFAGIIWLRLLEHGVGDEFSLNIERSLNWVLNNQFAINHPDENLRGAILNTRVRNRSGKVWIVNRDIGTSFGLRFLAGYHDYLQTK